MITIPIRTAVALRGDDWALNLNVHDPRGHRNVITENLQFYEWRAALRYRHLRRDFYSIADAARLAPRSAWEV